MSRTHVHRVHVEFGDCDPAQIVHFPNFFRWADAASRHFFSAAGVPTWQELTPLNGIIGTPIVDVQASFSAVASYGQDIEIHTSVTNWGNTSFAMTHRITRGDTLLAEVREKRVFARRHPSDPNRIQAAPIPPEIRAICE
jgi:4-hydroxybenzoyl-CoA thioesterase